MTHTVLTLSICPVAQRIGTTTVRVITLSILCLGATWDQAFPNLVQQVLEKLAHLENSANKTKKGTMLKQR